MPTHKRKKSPWAGWSRLAPNASQRTTMYKHCGQRCFLGKLAQNKRHPNFPICAKNTCRISRKGVYAAYVRARQWSSPKSDRRKHPSQNARRTYKHILRGISPFKTPLV